MILTRLRGGLGNQMFQYALGRVLSITRDEQLKLDITGYEAQLQGDTPRSFRLQFFNIQADIATPEEVQKAKYPYNIFSKLTRAFNQKVLKKHYIDFHPELLKKYQTQNPHDGITAQNRKLKECNIYLDGFFQSEKYYFTAELQKQLRDDFTLKPEYISDTMTVHTESIQVSPTSVSLHVRRGDYVTNKDANKAQGLCSIEYYAKAIAYIKSKTDNPHYFIFSDDIEWVKENFSQMYGDDSVLANTYPVTYVSQSNLQDYEELTLMSMCTHNIIANSSFSWWGAWLNANPAKIVIAPKQWTPTNLDHPNIIPESWITL